MLKTLYLSIMAAGIPVDNHESDLYFPVTPESTAILAQFPDKQTIASTFVNQKEPGGQQWYDVPFAYLPWWEARTFEKVTEYRAVTEETPLRAALAAVVEAMPEQDCQYHGKYKEVCAECIRFIQDKYGVDYAMAVIMAKDGAGNA